MPTRIVRANRLVRSSRIIILIGFGLVAAAALAVLIGLIRSRDADMLVLHTLEVQQTAQGLLISTRDAESAVRSFLLSSESDDLEPFEPALEKARYELDATRQAHLRQQHPARPRADARRPGSRQERAARANVSSLPSKVSAMPRLP